MSWANKLVFTLLKCRVSLNSLKLSHASVDRTGAVLCVFVCSAWRLRIHSQERDVFKIWVVYCVSAGPRPVSVGP